MLCVWIKAPGERKNERNANQLIRHEYRGMLLGVICLFLDRQQRIVVIGIVEYRQNRLLLVMSQHVLMALE